MIGGKTAKKLETLNIRTIRELAAADKNMLRDHFGIIADKMSDAARGIEKEEVKLYYDTHVPKSVSHGTTTPRDMTSFEDAKIVIYALSEMVAMRLRRYDLAAEGVALSVKEASLSSKNRQCVLPRATSNAADIAEAALKLLRTLHSFPAPLRAISVAAIKLCDRRSVQLSVFDSEEEMEKEERLDASLDKIRGKYGYKAVKRGLMLSNDLAVNLHEDDGFLPFKR